MSTSPPSTNGAASQIEWIRSPVAIEAFVARRTRASAAALSGGTGSSSQRGSYGSRAAATWAAVSGEKRPCISIIRSMSGPIASRTAATTAIARRRSPRRQPHARRPERVELHRPVAARHDAPCQLRDPCRLVVGLVPAVGIGRHPVAEAAAEELPDRDAELLADEVEEAMSNAASADWPCSLGRPYSRRSIAHASLSVSNGSAPIDVAAGQLLDDGDERVGLVDRPDLADAGQPGVGLELDEDEVAPRRPDDRGPDIRDLHATSSGGRRRDGSASRVRIPRGRRLEWKCADPDVAPSGGRSRASTADPRSRAVPVSRPTSGLAASSTPGRCSPSRLMP